MKLLHILAVFSIVLFIHSNAGERRTKSVGEEILKDQAIFRGFNNIIRRNRINLKLAEDDLKLLSASAEDKRKSVEHELENLKKNSEAGRMLEQVKRAEINYMIAVANYEEIEDEITALHQDIAKANATQLEKTREFNSLLDTIKSEIDIQEHVLEEFEQQLKYVIKIINNWFIEEQLREATIQYKHAHVEYDGKKASYEELKRILDKQYGEEFNEITDFDVEREKVKLAELQDNLKLKKKEMAGIRDQLKLEQITIQDYIDEIKARGDALRTNISVDRKKMLEIRQRIVGIDKELNSKTIKKDLKNKLNKLKTKLRNEVDDISVLSCLFQNKPSVKHMYTNGLIIKSYGAQFCVSGLLTDMRTEQQKSEKKLLQAKAEKTKINDNGKLNIQQKQVEIDRIKSMISNIEKNLQDWTNYRRLKNSTDAAKERLLAAESVMLEKAKAVTDLEEKFDPELLYSNRTKVMILHKSLLVKVQYRKDEIEFLQERYALIKNQEQIELQAIETELETLKLDFIESHIEEEKLKAEMDEKYHLMQEAEKYIHPSEVDEKTESLRNTSKILLLEFTKAKQKFLSVTDKLRKKRLMSLIHRTNIRNVLPYLRGANNTIYELREELKILQERCVGEGGEGVTEESAGHGEGKEETSGVGEGGEGATEESAGHGEGKEETSGGKGNILRSNLTFSLTKDIGDLISNCSQQNKTGNSTQDFKRCNQKLKVNVTVSLSLK
ncbi:unnamed protein product [Trichobilharzia szidati]|nr:unnamed protein product [Trichobilharzia szidati]